MKPKKSNQIEIKSNGFANCYIESQTGTKNFTYFFTKEKNIEITNELILPLKDKWQSIYRGIGGNIEMSWKLRGYICKEQRNIGFVPNYINK